MFVCAGYRALVRSLSAVKRSQKTGQEKYLFVHSFSRSLIQHLALTRPGEVPAFHFILIGYLQ